MVVGNVSLRGYSQGRGVGARGRLTGFILALAIQALLLLLLLSIGWGFSEPERKVTAITSFDVAEELPDEPDAPQQAVSAAPAADLPPRPAEPVPETPITPAPLTPLPPSPVAIPRTPAPPAPPAAIPSPSPTAPTRVYGPPDTGAQRTSDSERVGTAPGGQPLYAARWYREPKPVELAGYLSTADGPGTALIACRTVADYRVEDCELIGESPQGSRIGSAVLSAAWQFRVRPAIIGGRSQVGSWVRIRIDYRAQR